MMGQRASFLAACVVGIVAAAPCRADDETAVQDAFKGFQAAVKVKDEDKLWDLLDRKSREAVDSTAKEVKAAYQKADDAGKKKLEKALGLSGQELTGLTGKLFLKSNKYYGKYHEIPGSTVEKVTVAGDQATVSYKEEDGDKMKLDFVREDGKWRASAAP